jgi:Transposase DNA-binding
MDAWVEQELAAAEFPDERLKGRLGQLLADLGARIGGTIPAACQDWAATKAAYRFFDNPRVDDQTILGGHFAATTTRFAATTGTVLVLHDTTEFSFTRNTPDGVGYLSFVKGRHTTHTACGLLLHSSLVVTADRSVWRRSSSGPGRGSKAPTRPSGRSTRPPFRSRRRRASAGWTT